MSTGIIVDGQGDLLSLKAKLKTGYKILKTDGPRGDKASIEHILTRSRKQLSMLQALRCSRYIIMLDFEGRLVAYEEFCKEMKKQSEKMFPGLDIRFVVPNQMIENWYLADIEYLSAKKAFLRKNIKQRKYEGLHGKQELKKLFKHDVSYNETVHGPQLFVLVRDTVASKNSPSYKCFLEML